MKSPHFDHPGLLERLSFWGFWVFLIPSLAFAIYAPVQGIPLYGKTLLGAMFLLIISWSFRRERKGLPTRQIGQDHATRKRPENFQ